MSSCPLCGAAALYVGMVNTECATRDCANCKPGLPSEQPPTWGSYAWALVKHASGERVGYFDGYTFIEANPTHHGGTGPDRTWTLI